MALYAYKAMDAHGCTVLGKLDAMNLTDLEIRLKRMGLDFINGTSAGRGRFWASPVSRRSLINFCFHLEQLTRAGVPIVDGLIDLRDSLTDWRFREVIAGMIESIEGGKTLSQAMGEHPRVFDNVFISLARAGETSGKLPDVLRNLVESLKWQDELASQTKKLAMYPAFLGLAVLAVTFFMMTYLVPKMAVFIKGMGQELPLQTQLLIMTSGIFVKFWYLLLFGPIVAIVATIIMVRVNTSARYHFDRLKLTLPIVGAIQRKIILARFAGIFAMMYTSGISILDAIRMTETIVGNIVIKESLVRIGQLIGEGRNVTSAFQSEHLFPPLIIRMLRVGENTGALDTALLNVGYFYSRDVREAIGRAQTMVEPVMTLIVGLILGWVMLSVLGPIYDVIIQLKI